MTIYTRADLWRRAAAAFINLFALTVFLHPLQLVGINDSGSYAILQVLGICLCTYFYWSPGKWLMKLKVVKCDGDELSLKERVVRNLPLMIFFALPMLPLRAYSRDPGEEFVFDPVQFMLFLPVLIFLIFLLCNFLTPVFDKEDRTLLDMKLESTVGMRPQPLKFNAVKIN